MGKNRKTETGSRCRFLLVPRSAAPGGSGADPFPETDEKSVPQTPMQSIVVTLYAYTCTHIHAYLFHFV